MSTVEAGLMLCFRISFVKINPYMTRVECRPKFYCYSFAGSFLGLICAEGGSEGRYYCGGL